MDVSAAPVGLLWWNISGMSEVGLAAMMNEGRSLGSGSLRVCKQGALNPDLPEGKYLLCWFPSEKRI